MPRLLILGQGCFLCSRSPSLISALSPKPEGTSPNPRLHWCPWLGHLSCLPKMPGSASENLSPLYPNSILASLQALDSEFIFWVIHSEEKMIQSPLCILRSYFCETPTISSLLSILFLLFLQREGEGVYCKIIRRANTEVAFTMCPVLF